LFFLVTGSEKEKVMRGTPPIAGNGTGNVELARGWAMTAIFLVVVALPCFYMAIRLWDKASELRNTPAITKLIEIQVLGMPTHQEFERQRTIDAGRLDRQAKQWLAGGVIVIAGVLIGWVLLFRRIKPAASLPLVEHEKRAAEHSCQTRKH